MSPHNNGVWVFLLTLTCALHLLRGPVPRAAEVAGPPEWLSHRSLLASPAANNCYSTIDWGALPADPKTGVSAVFSPYNIVFGGGERYLLMAVAVLQQMGYAVHVLILEDNSCQTVAQLMEVAQGLRVPIDPAKVELHHVTLSENAIMGAPTRYTAFFLLGNEKYPQFGGLGQVNLYMCQFPFDLDRYIKDIHLATFASYDYVLLNSVYSYRWWHHFAEDMVNRTRAVHKIMPSIEVLHPPVHPPTNPPADVAGSLTPSSMLEKLTGTGLIDESGFENDDVGKRINIVMLGRFFAGRQSKGHTAAIDIFRELVEYLPRGSTLHLMGNLMKGHDAYLAGLRTQAQGLPVQFHVGAPAEEISKMLGTAIVQWHLTGFDSPPGTDPASEEHFGISVAEGMGMGCIPVVLKRGGLPDIVRHGLTGFLAKDLIEIKQYTLQVVQMEPSLTAMLRRKAAADVARFYDASFTAKFMTLVHRGRLTKPLRHLIVQSSDVVLRRQFTLPNKSKYAAVIIEPRQHYALEYTIKNVLFHLHGNWSLYCFHGLLNERFAKGALNSVHNAKLWRLNYDVLDIPRLNRLLTSTWFWRIFAAKKLLFFQTDALMVNGKLLPQFMHYDFVGAPWHPTNERWSIPVARRLIPQGVGNGGFSLRSVEAMIAISQRHGHNLSAAVQEDFFYVFHLSQSGGRFSVANRTAAYRFCLEVHCDDIPVPAGATLATLPAVPMAVHAAWYYFSDDKRMYSDLQRMLTMSVCGPLGNASHWS